MAWQLPHGTRLAGQISAGASLQHRTLSLTSHAGLRSSYMRALVRVRSAGAARVARHEGINPTLTGVRRPSPVIAWLRPQRSNPIPPPASSPLSRAFHPCPGQQATKMLCCGPLAPVFRGGQMSLPDSDVFRRCLFTSRPTKYVCFVGVARLTPTAHTVGCPSTLRATTADT